MKQFIYADKFFLEKQVAGPGFLEIKDGQFGGYHETLPHEETNINDLTGHWIAPGLVDTHIHGYQNHDVMDNDFEGLNAISIGLLSCGVTSFLPTTLTASTELLNEVVTMIGENYAEVQGPK